MTKTQLFDHTLGIDHACGIDYGLGIDHACGIVAKYNTKKLIFCETEISILNKKILFFENFLQNRNLRYK